MTERDPTCIGKVRHVLGATVTVALDNDLAGIAPIYKGYLQPIGQIGSLVRIPQGIIDLIGSVSLVGIAELSGAPAPSESVQRDERWLQVQLLGEIDRATGKFNRGVGSYPGLDDTVHFATPQHLRAIFPEASESHIRIGSLAAAEEVPVCLDAAKLVTRHAAIVGSTGSGKTSAVASIIQSFVRGGWKAANIIVIDPHGEYADALEENASIRSVLGEGQNQLRVPYWALPALDILTIFIGAPGTPTFYKRFVELVTLARKAFVEQADWLSLDPSAVTADTPVPFDIRPIWHRLDYENRETRNVKTDETTACVMNEGDAQELRPATFQIYGPNSTPPHKSPVYDTYGTSPNLLRLGLMKPELQCFQLPQGTTGGPDPLVEVMQDWLGGASPVSVLDFSGVPSVAADLSIGVVLNLLFEICLRSHLGGTGVGRASPVLIVLEEAHRYLGSKASAMTQESANRIAREGRKYGIGLLLVTQRPTELPETALAQCGTLIALRLANQKDQGSIASALPDTVAGLAAVLPSLRTGEAIISGEAIVLPVRGLLTMPRPRPHSEDPSLEPWRGDANIPELDNSLQKWRGTYGGSDV
jgi:hypothetical protein